MVIVNNYILHYLWIDGWNPTKLYHHLPICSMVLVYLPTSWVLIPITIDISAINHSEIGVMCANLANKLGHHLVHLPKFPPFFYNGDTKEMVETLVHEGSHHATAYTEDVEFKGEKVIRWRVMYDL